MCLLSMSMSMSIRRGSSYVGLNFVCAHKAYESNSYGDEANQETPNKERIPS